MKKTKRVEEKILPKMKKNENEICRGRGAKKYITQSEKSQNQTTEDQKKQAIIKSVYTSEILKKKLNWKRGKDNVKGGKKHKRNVYLMKERIIVSKKISIPLTMRKNMFKMSKFMRSDRF